MNLTRQSTIDVQVLDLTRVRAEAIQFANVSGGNSINRVRSDDWGVIQTTEGLYCLSREGFGTKEPISSENLLNIDLWGEKIITDKLGNDVIFGTTEPQWHVSLGSEDTLSLITERRENLSTFIVDFKPFNQHNFNEWNEFISNKFHWNLGELEYLKKL